jgi:transmembrane sensor
MNILVYAVAGIYRHFSADPTPPEYQTGIAQQAKVTLADQSEIQLGGDTSVLVSDAAYFRTMHVLRGEIFTTVHHDPNRPFQVVDGHITALDVGTAYDYAKHGSISNIAVIEGQVSLHQRNDLDQWSDPIVVEPEGLRRETVILGPGDLARMEQTPDGTVSVTRSHVSSDDAKERIQWLEGSMVASQRRLDEVTWEFNRYNRVQIVIDDASIGSMAWGGAFSLNNVEGFIGALRLQQHMDVDFVTGTDGQPSIVADDGLAPFRESIHV